MLCWYIFFSRCFSPQAVVPPECGFFRVFFTWDTAGLDFGQQHPSSFRLPSSGTCACQGVSAHVSWTFNETWWNSATYLEAHVGSFTAASQCNKAKRFLSCCMEKKWPRNMWHLNNFKEPSKLYFTLVLVFLEWKISINFCLILHFLYRVLCTNVGCLHMFHFAIMLSHFLFFKIQQAKMKLLVYSFSLSFVFFSFQKSSNCS